MNQEAVQKIAHPYIEMFRQKKEITVHFKTGKTKKVKNPSEILSAVMYGDGISVLNPFHDVSNHPSVQQSPGLFL